MHWLLAFLPFSCLTLCLGEEAIPSKLTLPKLPILNPLLGKPVEASKSSTDMATPADTKVNLPKPGPLIPTEVKIKLPTLPIPKSSAHNTTTAVVKVPCTCGVFLSGQVSAGQQPQGYPPLLQEYDQPMPCTPVGHRQCANKCLEVIARHLRNSATIICGSLDRDCFKERAFLWTKNCDDVWENSHMSAGREYCCKDGVPYKCPLGRS